MNTKYARKIVKKIVSVFVLCLFLVACSSKNQEINKLYSKAYQGQGNAQIMFIEKDGKKELVFKGKDVIGAIVDPSKITPEMEKKAQLQTFKNPTIKEENGKKYLTAESFEYKLRIEDENTIIDEEDDVKYLNVKK